MWSCWTARLVDGLGPLTLTSPFIGQQLVAFLAAALKAADRVPTHVVTSPVVQTAFVDVWEQMAQSETEQKEPDRNLLAGPEDCMRSYSLTLLAVTLSALTD